MFGLFWLRGFALRILGEGCVLSEYFNLVIGPFMGEGGALSH